MLLCCQNALYGTMVTSILYYCKFTKILKITEFEINQCGPCVTNKAIDGSQMKIFFHVDDCKLSHRKHEVNYFMIEWICQEYEIIFEDGSMKMSVSQGKVHEYLGRTLDYTICGQVKTTMFSYIEDILNSFDKAHPKGNGAK